MAQMTTTEAHELLMALDGELQSLIQIQHIYTEFRKTLPTTADAFSEPQQTVGVFIMQGYEGQAMIFVRRMADRNPDTHSFRRLLQRLKEETPLRSTVTVAELDQDLKDLDTLLSHLKPYANNYVFHLNKKEHQNPKIAAPNATIIPDAIALFEALFRKYNKAITGKTDPAEFVPLGHEMYQVAPVFAKLWK